eukprot:1464230-Pyramimonas_sp.AAC.1
MARAACLWLKPCLVYRDTSILRVATRPAMERNACFLGNNDLGQLVTTSPSQCKVVSVALTLWAEPAGLAAPWSSTGPLPRTATQGLGAE